MSVGQTYSRVFKVKSGDIELNYEVKIDFFVAGDCEEAMLPLSETGEYTAILVNTVNSQEIATIDVEVDPLTTEY